MVYDILQQKNAFLGYKKILKLEKLSFFQRG